MCLDKNVGMRNRRWLEELISELYEEYAKIEAEQGFAEIEDDEKK